MYAAEVEGGMVIGVDVDQAEYSDTVLTSAMKELGEAVQIGLRTWYFDEFFGGQSIYFGAASGCIGLPMDTSRFTTFTEGEYNVILNQLAYGTIVVPSDYDQLLAFLNNGTLDIPSREVVTGMIE